MTVPEMHGDVRSQHYGKAAVRASMMHLLVGKAFNASVSAVILVVLARWMSTENYGTFVALLALQATLLAVSNLGIEATAERYLPELRTRHSDRQLLGFVLAGLAARLLTLVLVAGVGALAGGLISQWLGLNELGKVFRIWMLVVIFYGAFIFACVLLESMLKQKHAQVAMSVYLGTKLALIVMLHMSFGLDLEWIVATEVFASLVAAVFALTLLIREFNRSGLDAGWRLVLDNQSRLKRFAAFNYAAQCVFQLFSADVMKLLVTRLLGAASAASYGFAASLADIVQRFLPATLLQRMIKPVFISRYVTSGDFGVLNQMARLVLKLNLLLLIPAIALATAYGAELLGLLTGGKYANGHWLLVGALCLLVLASHQAILSFLASTLERNGMQFYAGLSAGVGLPLALLLIPRLGPLGAIAGAATSALVYNTVATLYLRNEGYAYRPDWRALGSFTIAGLLLTVGLVLSKRLLEGQVTLLVLVTLLSALGYLLLLRKLSVFSSEERSLLNAVLPKPLFVL